MLLSQGLVNMDGYKPTLEVWNNYATQNVD